MSKGRKYRSGPERVLGDGVFKHFAFEPFRMSYPINKVCQYIPDFVDMNNKIIFEVKGYFRTRHDATKYDAVIPEARRIGYRFIFIFENPSVAMPGVRVRQNGTRQSVSEWADRHGYEWYPMTMIPRKFLL